jgi:menaquinone-dependent protoporphyrinogen IX oxidase
MCKRQKAGLVRYRAVVLGAPLYMFHWHADARHFGRSTAPFSPRCRSRFALGPFPNKEDELTSAREQLIKSC